MSIELRDYQKEAIDSIYRYYNNGGNGNILVVAPTGSGKGWIIAKFIQEVLEFPNQRVLLLSHRKELLDQTANNLYKLWPEAPIGIYSAGLGKKQLGKKITIAGIQSIFRKGSNVGPVNLILIDEVHLVPPADYGMYRKLFSDLQAENPKVKIIGFTATPYRLKTGSLVDDSGIFSEIVHDIDVAKLVHEGYLSNLVTKHSKVQANLSEVGTRGGEFIPSELEKAMNVDALTQRALLEVERLAADRKSWLVFCSGVDHAKDVTAALNARGHDAACIVGETDSLFRAMYIKQFKEGKLKCIVNCDVLTTGFDAPNVDCLIMLRATKSTGLYVQIVGRGMRLSPGKTNCLVLDFAGNIKRHGPIDSIKLRKNKKGETEVVGAPTKTCPQCESEIHAAMKECPDCGFVFPEREIKLEREAETAEILSKPEWRVITGVSYSTHRKVGSPDSMRVIYEITRYYSVSEWVCFNHDGYAREKAVSWWLKRGKKPAPRSVDEALGRISELKKPSRICVKTEGKWDRVSLYDFNQIKELTSAEEDFTLNKELPNI